MNKNSVINGVKGSREIKEAKCCDFLLTHCLDEMIMYCQKCRLGRMMLGVSSSNNLVDHLTSDGAE